MMRWAATNTDVIDSQQQSILYDTFTLPHKRSPSCYHSLEFVLCQCLHSNLCRTVPVNRFPHSFYFNCFASFEFYLFIVYIFFGIVRCSVVDLLIIYSYFIFTFGGVSVTICFRAYTSIQLTFLFCFTMKEFLSFSIVFCIGVMCTMHVHYYYFRWWMLTKLNRNCSGCNYAPPNQQQKKRNDFATRAHVNFTQISTTIVDAGCFILEW